MARTYAKLVTPNGEYRMSHRQLDELRMLLALRERKGFCPNASPEVFESDYDDLLEWISADFDSHATSEREYLD